MSDCVGVGSQQLVILTYDFINLNCSQSRLISTWDSTVAWPGRSLLCYSMEFYLNYVFVQQFQE